jgi:hypothetical protein
VLARSFLIKMTASQDSDQESGSRGGINEFLLKADGNQNWNLLIVNVTPGQGK